MKILYLVSYAEVRPSKFPLSFWGTVSRTPVCRRFQPPEIHLSNDITALLIKLNFDFLLIDQKKCGSL